MAARSVIAEAIVRIRPDLTGFRAETQRGVVAATRVPVGVSTSMRAAIAADLAGIRKLQTELDSVTAKTAQAQQQVLVRGAGVRGGLLGALGPTVAITAIIAAAAGLRSTFNAARDSSLELNTEVDQLSAEATELQGRIAEGLTPAFIGFTDILGDSLRAANNLAEGLGNLADAIPELPAGRARNFFLDVLPGVGQLRDLGRGADAINSLFDAAGEDAGEAFVSGLIAKTAIETKSRLAPAAGLAAQDMLEAMKVSGERVDLRTAGGVAASLYVDAVARTLIQGEVEVVNAARATLGEVVRAGREAVSEAIRQGNEAVRLSAIEARTNLVSIGQSLASDALLLLEEGPLARRIEALRASLDRTQFGNERSRLRQNLSDAERALNDAERRLFVAGPLTDAQKQGNQRFLEPFQRDVRDAKAALGEFNTETVIGRLQAQLDAQKTAVSEGIANLVSQFNTGGLTLQGLNVKLANLLRVTGLESFGKAGSALGTRFRQEFDAAVKQAAEILKGPNVPKGALGPEVVSPSGVRAQQDKNVAQTQAESDRRTRESQALLRGAQNDLRDAVNKNTSSIDNLPRDIAAAVRAALGLPKKPSVAASPGSSGDRSSGRTP